VVSRSEEVMTAESSVRVLSKREREVFVEGGGCGKAGRKKGGDECAEGDVFAAGPE